MRLTLTLLATVLLTAACSGLSTKNDSPPPKYGRVLSASSGTGPIVFSLGAQDGVKSGEAFPVLRNGKCVSHLIVHEVRATQAVGTAYGPASNGSIRPGDTVVVPQ